MVVQMMGSAASSRAMTPVPGQQQQAGVSATRITNLVTQNF